MSNITDASLSLSKKFANDIADELMVGCPEDDAEMFSDHLAIHLCVGKAPPGGRAMTAAEFWAAQPGSGMATKAAYLVLVDGLGIREAARQAGVDPGAVSRACKVIRAAVAGNCPECGRPL